MRLDRNSSLRVILLLFGIAIAMALLLIRGSAVSERRGDAPSVVVESSPGDVGEVVPPPKVVSREPVRIEPSADQVIPIEVWSQDGHTVVATVATDQGTWTIHGRGVVPMHSGTAEIASEGFASARVEIADEPVHVVLIPAYELEIYVYDATTDAPIEGAAVRIENVVGNVAAASGTTDWAGTFRADGIPRGDVLIGGGAKGYVPFCESLEANDPGVTVEVADDRRVEIPCFPIYVTLCLVQNHTNLQDTVLGGLLSCGFMKPLANLPAWCDRVVSRSIADVADSRGYELAYGHAYCAVRPHTDLEGRISFWLMGSPAGSDKVWFQSYETFLDEPTPTMCAISRTFPVGALTVESPVPLRICDTGTAIFGGIETKPGSSTFELPHGSYVVSPLDEDFLLDEKWTTKVEVPEQKFVKISPSAGFGTLRLVRGGAA